MSDGWPYSIQVVAESSTRPSRDGRVRWRYEITALEVTYRSAYLWSDSGAALRAGRSRVEQIVAAWIVSEWPS